MNLLKRRIYVLRQQYIHYKKGFKHTPQYKRLSQNNSKISQLWKLKERKSQ